MDHIDDLVNRVKATARQAAEDLRDQADQAARALADEPAMPPTDEERTEELPRDEAADAARLTQVGESIRGTVPKASGDPDAQRDGGHGPTGGARRPWRD